LKEGYFDTLKGEKEKKVDNLKRVSGKYY